MKTDFQINNDPDSWQRILAFLAQLPGDSTYRVTVSDKGSKSIHQRGLQWRWYTEVAESGIGGRHEETKNTVARFAKWEFGRPIYRRDEPEAWDKIARLIDKAQGELDLIELIIDECIHTEDFDTKQMAEFLTDFERYYRSKGVDLTIPDKGLLEWVEANA